MAWCFADNGNHAIKHCQALPTNGWDLVGHLRKNGQGRKVSFSAMPKAGFPTFYPIPGGHHHANVHVALHNANVQASCQAGGASLAGIAMVTGMGLPMVWL